MILSYFIFFSFKIDFSLFLTMYQLLIKKSKAKLLSSAVHGHKPPKFLRVPKIPGGRGESWV